MLDLAHLPPERTGRLRALLDEVLRVNRQFNLTAVRQPDEAWTKHILDSLQGLKTGFFEGARRVADVGAGAGFPGLALAIARPDLRVTLLDSTRKKCDFMAAAIEKFALNADVLCERAEIAGQNKQWREQFDVATARAVGSLGEVCELALPLIKVGGHLVLWRGAQAREELYQSRSALSKLGGAAAGSVAAGGVKAEAGAVLPYTLPGHNTSYHLVVIEKVKPTPPGYPRRVGLPKQRPL